MKRQSEPQSRTPSERGRSRAFPTNPRVVAREIEVETFRAGGPGGQHRNVTDSAVRIRHLPSGIQVVAAESRSQHRNREVAFLRLLRRLEQLNKRPKPRIPTKKKPGAEERRLTHKKGRARVKGLRKPVKDLE